MRGAKALIGLMAAAAVAGVGEAAPPRYRVTVIPPPAGSEFQAGPRAINDQGWVTGNWGQYGAFLYRPGEGTVSIGTPAGQPYLAPRDINNRGEIVGASASELIKLSTEAQVFRWRDGAFQMYPQLVPGRIANVGLMNDLGRVVGDANDGSFIGYKALEYLPDGGIVELFPATSTYDHAIDINNAGQILGTEIRGIFRWRFPEEPEPSFLPAFPGWIIEVQAMNDRGDVVGLSRETPGHTETRTASLYTDDGGWRLLPRNGRRCIPTSINSAREVVGNTQDGSIIGDHGWRWTAADGLIPLNELIEPPGSYRVWTAMDINEAGQIVAGGEEQATGRSVGMVLTPIRDCAADFNGDGLVDFADYLEFLNLYGVGDGRADFTGDGLVDFSDYLEFLARYDAGC